MSIFRLVLDLYAAENNHFGTSAASKMRRARNRTLKMTIIIGKKDKSHKR